ncbi:MAG: hypothetical protein Q9216_002897 [Gyalolechia sp. 2 TL-2023]
MPEYALESYQYEDLPTTPPGSFRVAEILPGRADDPVSCLLHTTDWSNPLEYEAISYAWGDPNIRATVICQGKRLEVTRNLYEALAQLRHPDRSRLLYADALCINQPNIPERGYQVRQMRKIYGKAKVVLSWVGPVAQDHQDAVAVDSIRKISNFLCQKLGISISDLHSIGNIYQNLILKNRADLPLPNECQFSTDATWKSLVWFYSHPYFTRVWVIQEVIANKERTVHCGREKIGWECVDLVAGYITMEPAFSKCFGFADTYCWWVSTMTELTRNPKNWLSMLYLASTYSCLDARDVIYGLRGLMELSDGGELLDPDYSKSVLEVYRDSVEAAILNFQNTDIFTYVTGDGNPSWVPQWNRPMLFRNPFRFGRSLPWRPSGGTTAISSIDKELNIISLTGFYVDSVKLFEPYNEGFFSNATVDSDEGKRVLPQVWQRILMTVEESQSKIPIDSRTLAAVATSFSFGLDERTDPADERYLLRNFVAYLKIVLDEETFGRYISSALAEESASANGHAFGKPAWDFEYPESSFFITKNGFFGCAVSAVRRGDVVCVALGSTYPFILRPEGNKFLIRGYTYVHGLMHGELQNSERRVFRIR